MKILELRRRYHTILITTLMVVLYAVPAMCYDQPYSANWSGNLGTKWSSIFNWAGTMPPITNGPMLTFGDFYSRDTDYFDENNYVESVPVRSRVSVNDFIHTLVVDRVIIHENYHISGNPIAFDSTGFGFYGNLGGCGNIISDSTFQLNISMPNQKEFNITQGCGYALAMGGIISGEGGITKTGGGRLKLNGESKQFTGDLIVNNGTLIVDTTVINPSSTVVNGGFLRGSGAIFNDITVKNGGTVYPGRGDLTSLIGNVSFEAGSTFKVDIARSGSLTDADALILSGGGVTLGDGSNWPSFEPVFFNTPAIGQKYTIIGGAGGVAGHFDGLSEGGAGNVDDINYSITYQGGASGNKVVITITDGPTATATSISAQNPTYQYGADPLIFLEVKAQEGTNRPTGTASYSLNGMNLKTCDLDVNGGDANSLCYITLTNPTAGTYALNALYPGGSGFGPSDTEVSSAFTVTKATPTVVFSSSATEISPDEFITFDFETYGAPGGGDEATGSVIILDNGEQIENCVKGLDELGAASCQTLLTEPGLHTITADYAGDNNYNALTRILVNQITVHAPPVISSNSSTTFTAGKAGSFSITTSSCYPTPSLDVSGTLPGSLSFVDNGDGTGTISGIPDTVGAKGYYDLTITASNGIGTDDVQDFILKVEKPEIKIIGGQLITDGDMTPSIAEYTDFGAVPINTGPVDTTFRIYNTGNIALLLTGSPIVAVSGPQAGDFTITQQPSSTLSAGTEESLIITFQPTALGLRTATVTIANNDADENPYDFAIQGTGVPSSPIVTSCTVSSIGETRATCQAEVSQLGYPEPTQHGFVWNMTGSPTINDAKTEEGAVSTTGPFSSLLDDLTPETTYFARSYATNTLETIYGSEVSFITKSDFPWIIFYPAIQNGKK